MIRGVGGFIEEIEENNKDKEGGGDRWSVKSYDGTLNEIEYYYYYYYYYSEGTDI